jgi:hypothetical protein
MRWFNRIFTQEVFRDWIGTFQIDVGSDPNYVLAYCLRATVVLITKMSNLDLQRHESDIASFHLIPTNQQVTCTVIRHLFVDCNTAPVVVRASLE